MNFKSYGTKMLEKQLKYATQKGNEKYVHELATELERRSKEKEAKDLKSAKRVSQEPMTAKSSDVVEVKPDVIEQPTPPLNEDVSEAILTSNESTEGVPSE